ncbi:MAG: 23S rRNA (pseudouridine(1915)-N(3))-methyltransferase RlmH [Desulfuromonadales bacterium]|nr:23S rRNA (pseudouridine(1915)-N(3))-methyltransferase RlmH [Desulfuromonadales bacterium]
MKLHLLCIGKLSEPWLRDGCQQFAGRLQHYLPLTITELKESKTGRKPDLPRIVAEEGTALLQRVGSGGPLIALDARGKSLDSPGLAGLLDRQMLDGVPQLTFLIGGPYGLSDAVRDRADRLLSLSALTLTHQMARLLLLEQLYRACTILRNEPYHH